MPDDLLRARLPRYPAIPLVYAFAVWGTINIPDTVSHDAWRRAMALDRSVVLQARRDEVAGGSSFFNGPDSAAKKLGLS